MATLKLNKELFLNINSLKSLGSASSKPRFVLEKTPFGDDDDDGCGEAAAVSKEVIVIGRVFPESEIYNQGSFQIEMKLPPTFPFEPPQVRFLTKIYHPLVAENGDFCNELLQKHAKWTSKISLIDVIKVINQHIDQPNIDFSLSVDLGRQYRENRPEFNRKALEYVKKHALPRD